MTKTKAIDDMLAHITSECTAVNTEALFDDMLDECYSFDKVGGPFSYLTPSRVMKEMMETDYRCGHADYIDSLRLIEIGSDNYQPDDVSKAQEEFIDGLKSELTDLQNELEDLNDEDIGEGRKIRHQIAEKEAEINECEQYQF